MNTLTRFFGEAEYSFALTADLILELERKAGVGIGHLCKRLFAGQFGFSDIQEVIRLSLIGGGMNPQNAAGLVQTYTAARPLAENFALAVAILETLYFGAADNGQA